MSDTHHSTNIYSKTVHNVKCHTSHWKIRIKLTVGFIIFPSQSSLIQEKKKKNNSDICSCIQQHALTGVCKPCTNIKQNLTYVIIDDISIKYKQSQEQSKLYLNLILHMNMPLGLPQMRTTSALIINKRRETANSHVIVQKKN